MATAGSKEAKQLEQIKNTFDKAYKEMAKASESDYDVTTDSDSDIKYSASRRIETEEDVEKYLNTAKNNTSKKNTIRAWKNGEKVILRSDEDIEGFIVDSVNHVGGKKQAAYGQVSNKLAEAVAEKDPNINIKDYYLELNPSDLEHTFKHSKEDTEYPGNIPLTMEDMKNLPNYIENFTDIIDTVNKKTKNNKVKKIQIGTRVNGYSIITTIVSDGRNSVRPKTMYKVNTEDYLKLLNGEKIKKKRANVDAQAQRLEDDPNGSPSIVNSSSEENILYNNKNVKFSLSDNQGRELTKEQQEYFKYSKVRDENGNLLTVYHGSKNKFNVFTSDINWFSSSKEYSNNYGKEANLFNKVTKREPKKSKVTFETYLNIKNTIIAKDEPIHAEAEPKKTQS